MKSILMSIRPKRIERIVSREIKMLPVKTAPVGGAPFKVYMYCTKAKSKGDELYKGACSIDPTLCNGKVVGEFFCDFLSVFSGLHISDLKIYDKPKELSEFVIPCSCEDFGDGDKCNKCSHQKSILSFDDIEFYCDRTVTRPPQSWCYVEEL